MKTEDILTKICQANYEAVPDSETHRAIKECMQNFCEDITTDALGNLICTVKSGGKKHVVLSAHMDKIGMIITSIDKKTGLLGFTKCGGTDLRTLSAARVKVCGKKTLYGCITSTPPHLTTGDRKVVTPVESLYIDCGKPYEEIIKYVSIGDFAQYHSPVTSLLGDKRSGAYMDNSAGCTAVIKACEKIAQSSCENSVTAVFTTREEIGKGGAQTAFTRLQPNLALITDVSFASAPDIPSEVSSPLTSGAMIGFSPILQKEVSSSLVNLAEKNSIPHTIEVLGSRTATDCDVAVISGCGVKTGLVSIPLLNMHTPVETLSLSDVDAVAELLFTAAKED